MCMCVCEICAYECFLVLFGENSSSGEEELRFDYIGIMYVAVRIWRGRCLDTSDMIQHTKNTYEECLENEAITRDPTKKASIGIRL